MRRKKEQAKGLDGVSCAWSAHLARLFLKVQLEMMVESACACALVNRSNTPTAAGMSETNCMYCAT